MELGTFSISLAVKDLEASRQFYEKFGFKAFAGDPSQNWLILKNGDHAIGLFQGMFDKNILTFNPARVWASAGGGPGVRQSAGGRVGAFRARTFVRAGWNRRGVAGAGGIDAAGHRTDRFVSAGAARHTSRPVGGAAASM